MAAHAHAQDPDAPVVYEQFEDIDQQQETYILGMWAFVVQEIMFFGPLFVIYALYRWKYQPDFYIFHNKLNWQLGGINTAVLLFSSFAVALAVHYAQVKKPRIQIAWLVVTCLCALAFLVIKYFEYKDKFDHHLYPGVAWWIPGYEFHWDAATYGGNPEHAKLFFSLYFSITGLHGLHVLIGMVIFSILIYLTATKNKVITDYIPTEMIGLYWHFVDLVWIFLYPLFYLIPK
jgi:cytochrome c oxidase subunit III